MAFVETESGQTVLLTAQASANSLVFRGRQLASPHLDLGVVSRIRKMVELISREWQSHAKYQFESVEARQAYHKLGISAEMVLDRWRLAVPDLHPDRELSKTLR